MQRQFRERRTLATTVVIVGAADFARRTRQDVLNAGLRPVCAPDASEALTAIMHGRPALVVIDAAMPDPDRLWLLAKLERATALARIPRAVLPRGRRLSPSNDNWH